jgi:predicted ATP-grasp superfamily ATP-dependent carboligase
MLGWFCKGFNAFMKILVTDGEGRSSLAATRSLGRQGYTVLVCGSSAYTLASSSRFCHQGAAVPDPLKNGGGYAEAICNLAFEEGIDVILPMTEQSIYLLNPCRKRLPNNTTLACPGPEQVHILSNKVSLFQLAERLGIATPQTFFLKNNNDLPLITNSIAEYPVVIKPALSRIAVNEGFLATNVTYAADRAELEAQYATNPALRFPSMIQEKIVGLGTGLFTLYATDRHLALFSHRRLREKPPSGGVSVVSESVPLDGEMVEAASRLLSAVGWQGVAMVEFKRDERDGKAKLMEINGRFWGTLQLAVVCGVDFPCLLLNTLQEKSLNHRVGEYRIGHKMKWFFGTLDHLLIRLKNDDAALQLPPWAPTKWGAFKDFVKIFSRNTSFDVFDRRDIWPFIHEAKSYFSQIMRG